ncbi:hypothetical protein ACFC0K_15720 [Streptomyces hydrogenans]|uniref:hypothetical protein n=1 Tax=Streptomyces hydrogenans TaxID=1873719 RepID=UPI0035DF351E
MGRWYCTCTECGEKYWDESNVKIDGECSNCREPRECSRCQRALTSFEKEQFHWGKRCVACQNHQRMKMAVEVLAVIAALVLLVTLTDGWGGGGPDCGIEAMNPRSGC